MIPAGWNDRHRTGDGQHRVQSTTMHKSVHGGVSLLISNTAMWSYHTLSYETIQEVIFISGNPIEAYRSQIYRRKIGDTEITVENLHPQFQDEEEQTIAKSAIKQTLYEVFSKYYEENC